MLFLDKKTSYQKLHYYHKLVLNLNVMLIEVPYSGGGTEKMNISLICKNKRLRENA